MQTYIGDKWKKSGLWEKREWKILNKYLNKNKMTWKGEKNQQKI